MAKRSSEPMAEAVAAATRTVEKRGTAKRKRGGGALEVFGGELRRRDLFPLLVLHLVQREPTYGNRLIEEIEEMTRGVISVNPNTMYPLLRELESDGKIEGHWEHPEKRSRRFYQLTDDGRDEYERLLSEIEPFLDSVVESVTLIKNEVYGEGSSDGDG